MYLDTLYPIHFYLPCTYFYGHIVITDDQVIQISEMGKMKLSRKTYPTEFTHGLILHYLLYWYGSSWQIYWDMVFQFTQYLRLLRWQ